MKTALLIEEKGLELRLEPESAYDRALLKTFSDVAKIPVVTNVLTIPVPRDASRENGPAATNAKPPVRGPEDQP